MSIRVVFIAGAGRSGSTLLGTVLAQVPGFFGLGQPRDVISRGHERGGPCSCGRSFRDCSFWMPVFERTFGGNTERKLELYSTQLRALGAVGPQADSVVISGREQATRCRARSPEFFDLLEALYVHCADAAGVRTLVDASKTPNYAMMLTASDELDLRVVHLIRDPRAVAISWKKRNGFPIYTVSRGWVKRNRAVRDMFGGDHYKPVRYEDLVASPRKTVEEIISWLGEPVPPDLFESERVVRVARGKVHAFAGSDERLEGSERLAIADAQRWRASIRLRDRLAIGIATAGQLRQYGYRTLA